MRRLGYPPGWLKAAEIAPSGMALYTNKGEVITLNVLYIYLIYVCMQIYKCTTSLNDLWLNGYHMFPAFFCCLPPLRVSVFSYPL